MSFQAMTWAIEQKLKTNEKMVLLMLANHSNGYTGQCNPSHARLAEECGMCKTALLKAIKSLENGNYLSIVSTRTGKINLPNQYQLNLNSSASNGLGGSPSNGLGSASNGLGGSPSNGLGSASNGLGGSPLDAPEPVNIKPVIEPITTTDAKAKKSEKTKKIENDFDVENGFNDLPKELHHAYHYATHNDYWSQTIYDAASFLLVWNNPKRKLRGQYERLIQQSQERKKRHEAKEAKQQAQKNPQATANLNAGSLNSINGSQSGDNHYGTRPQPRQESLFNRVRTREDYLNDPTPF